MMKKITFTMSVIYNEEDINANNALDAIEHELFNIEGVKQWNVEDQNVVIEDIEVEYDDEEEYDFHEGEYVIHNED